MSDRIKEPTILIDASIYIFQYYFSLPDNWYSQKEQWPTAAVYGYSTFLIRLLLEEQPQRIAACFDESLESCFRNEIYPEYKSSRALPDEALAFQLQACREITELFGISCYGSERYEADDLLGSLYTKQLRSRNPIAILTRDKDLGQLIKREQDFLWDYAGEKKHFDRDIEKKFGVKPEQLNHYLALVGDTSDDIPGVPGIGSKTAAEILKHFASIDDLKNNLSDLSELKIRGAKKLPDKFAEYWPQIEMANSLATIVTDIPLIKTVNDIQWQTPKWKKLEKYCEAMGFERLYKRVEQLKSKIK
jgi:5'-3' exonuclease